MAQAKKGLGRGLSALIPTDMDFLAEVARGDFSVLATPDSAPLREQALAEAAPASSEMILSVPQPATHQDAPIGRDSLEPLDVGSMSVGDALRRRLNRGEGAGAVLWVSPAEIEVNPYQPRRSFDAEELSNLADSIREHGVLQPIIVRPIGMGWGFSLDAEQNGKKFQLIAGERRWRAAQTAGLDRLPVIVREVSDQQALELAIIENVQRHDISALDAAIAYKRLSQEFGLSHEKIAQRVGKSRPSVANTVRLLDLPPEAQQAIQEGVLSQGHGIAILLAPGHSERRAVLREVLRAKLSVRQTEAMASRIARQSQAQAQADPDWIFSRDSARSVEAQRSEATTELTPGATTRSHQNGDQDGALEERLQRALSCRVQIKRRRRGGQIVLNATDDEQLEHLAAVLGEKKD